jgi:hypothetical protein
MPTTSSRAFLKNYSASLLPITNSNIALGDLWIQRSFLQSKRLSPENDNAALVCGNHVLYNQLIAVQAVAAALPDIDITEDFNAEANATIPSLQTSIETAAGIEKVTKMHINGVTCKPITVYKNDLRDSIATLRNTDAPKYRKYLKRHVIITALYYAASVTIEFDKKVSSKADFETNLRQALRVNADISYNGATSVKVVMNNSLSPFAANFERGKNI